MLGLCPCPRCFAKKHELEKLGQVHDMKKRHTNPRVDSAARRRAVAGARRAIFELGKPVKGAAVDRFLQKTSDLAINVRLLVLATTSHANFTTRMHFPISSRRLIRPATF